MSERELHDSACEHSVDAAAYVLAALDEHEAQAFSEHLHDCDICRAEVTQLQVTADSLALAPPQLVAPIDLRARIMSTVHAEAELLKAAGHEADRPVRARSRSRWRWQMAPALAAATALAVGMLIGALAINTGSSTQRTRVIQAQVSIPGHFAVASLRKIGSHLELDVSGMPAPPPGRIYEVWLLKAGSAAPEPTDALFGVTTLGKGAVVVPSIPNGSFKVLVTDEPLGGSLKPTRTPVISASI